MGEALMPRRGVTSRNSLYYWVASTIESIELKSFTLTGILTANQSDALHFSYCNCHVYGAISDPIHLCSIWSEYFAGSDVEPSSTTYKLFVGNEDAPRATWTVWYGEIINDFVYVNSDPQALGLRSIYMNGLLITLEIYDPGSEYCHHNIQYDRYLVSSTNHDAYPDGEYRRPGENPDYFHSKWITTGDLQLGDTYYESIEVIN